MSLVSYPVWSGLKRLPKQKSMRCVFTPSEMGRRSSVGCLYVELEKGTPPGQTQPHTRVHHLVSREQTDSRTKPVVYSWAMNSLPNQNVQLKGCRMFHPKMCHFGIVIILNESYLRNSQCKDALTLLCPSESRKEISHMKGIHPVPRRWKPSLSPETGNLGPRRLHKQALLLPINFYLWPKLPFLVNSSQMYCFFV